MSKSSSGKKALAAKERDALLETLQARFEKHPQRHPKLAWADVKQRLESAAPAKLWSLAEMERTGGEPDVVSRDAKSGELMFVDCAEQSPSGRQSLCYDEEALESRKKFKPEGSAEGLAASMGVELLDEEGYFAFQRIGEFDTKTSSWLKTPPAIRELGGAIFGDRRFGRVFIYHNGAESYYSGRGFRAVLRV